MTFQGDAQDVWHTLTPTAPYTTGTVPIAVRFDSASNIHLRGHVIRNAAASGATVFVLDEPYRPTASMGRLLLTLPYSSTGMLSITPAGVVTLGQLTGTVTDYYLDTVAPWTAL